MRIDDLQAFRENVLYPCVRVRTEKAGGSGQVIHASEENGIFVLTCHHVVEDSIELKDQWSGVLQQKIKKDIFGPVSVEFFNFEYADRANGSQGVEAEIICYSPDDDIALLRVKGKPQLKGNPPGGAYVAKMFSCTGLDDSTVAERINYMSETITVGCGLGENPITTPGNLCEFNRTIENKEYWQNTAASVFGNSGGASFLTETWEFIGMPARVAVVGGGFSSAPITHMGYIVPITRIMDFFRENLMEFLYDPDTTYAECKKKIKEKREMHEKGLAAKLLREE